MNNTNDMYNQYPQYNDMNYNQGYEYNNTINNIPSGYIPPQSKVKVKKRTRKFSFFLGFLTGMVFLLVAVVASTLIVAKTVKISDVERMLNISIVRDDSVKSCTLEQFIRTMTDANTLSVNKVEGIFGEVVPTTYDETINKLTNKYLEIPDFRDAPLATLVPGFSDIINNIVVTDTIDAVEDFAQIPSLLKTFLNMKFGTQKFRDVIDNLGTNIDGITVKDCVDAYKQDCTTNGIEIDEKLNDVLTFASDNLGTISVLQFAKNVEYHLKGLALVSTMTQLDTIFPESVTAIFKRVYGTELSVGNFLDNMESYLNYLYVEDVTGVFDGFGANVPQAITDFLNKYFAKEQFIDFVNNIEAKVYALKIKTIADEFGIQYQITEEKTELNLLEQVVANCVENDYTVQDVINNYETIISDSVGDLTVQDVKDMTGLDITSYIKSLNYTDKLSSLNTKFENLTLGDVFGTTTDKLLNLIKDVKINEVSDPVNGVVGKISDAKISDIIDLGANPSKLLNAISNLSINDLKNDSSIQNAISDLTIADIMDLGTNPSKIIETLGAIKIGELTTKIDTLQLKDFIDITSASPKILQALKDSTLTNLSDSVNNLTIGSVVSADSSVLKLFKNGANTKLSEIETGMKDFNTMTLQELAEIANTSKTIPAKYQSYTLDQIIDLLSEIG